MKRLTLLTLACLPALLVACGQENSQSPAASTILAVRTMEGDQNRTEVAVLSGDISSPEEAKAAAEDATWVPIDQFSESSDFSFVSADELDDSSEFQEANMTYMDARVGNPPGYNPPGYNPPGTGPGNRPGYNPPGYNPPGAGPGYRPGYNPPGYNPPGYNPPGAGPGNRPGYNPPGYNPPGTGPGYRPGYRPGWTPYPSSYWGYWNRPWYAPTTHFWNYSSCNYTYIYWGSRCVVPFSTSYNYFWRPRWGYVAPMGCFTCVRYTTANWYVRFYF